MAKGLKVLQIDKQTDRKILDQVGTSLVNLGLLPDQDWDKGGWYVVMRNSRVLGVGGVIPMRKRHALLAALHVHPRHRRKGIGRMLTRARIRWAVRNGIQELWSYTRPESVASMNNLLKAGFRPSPPRVAVQHGDDFVYWKRVMALPKGKACR